MKKQTIKAYVYHTKCFECNKEIPVYHVSDPWTLTIIKKCKFRDMLYAYTPYDERERPLEKQLEGKTCVKCNAELAKALVATHTHIKCCNSEFSLDDDFADLFGRDSDVMENVEAYSIY